VLQRQSYFVGLKQAETFTLHSALCREYGMCSMSFYKLRATYGGIEASLINPKKYETVLEAMAKKW